MRNVPYGFIKHLEDKGYSQKTLIGYQRTLSIFFGYLNKKYKKALEPFQISSGDIKEFLQYRIDEGTTLNTVNKDLSILKTFFNYLWEIDKVPVDYAVKIPRFKDENKKGSFINFSILLDIRDKVLKNTEYSAFIKSIYILGMYGLRSSEFHFKKEDVILNSDDSVTIHLSNRSITLEGEYASIFLEHFDQSLFQSSEFVFTSKKHTDTYVAIEVMTLLLQMRKISHDYKLPIRLTLNSMRLAYAHYLYNDEHYSIQDIASLLGIQESSAATLTKGTIEKLISEIS